MHTELDRICAVVFFVLPGIIMVVARNRVARAFTQANKKSEKMLGGRNPQKFSARAICLLGIGWFLAGVLMFILWR